MTQILANFQQQFAAAPPIEGRLAEAPSAALDALVDLLSHLPDSSDLTPSASLALLAGLHAIHQTALLAPSDASRGTGAWAFVHKPFGSAGALLSLSRTAPQASLDLQLDPTGQPHGMMHLQAGDCADLLSLEHDGPLWLLRSHEPDPPRTYRLQLPPGASLAWQTSPTRDYLRELLPETPALGLAVWAARKVAAVATTAIPVVATPAAPPPPAPSPSPSAPPLSPTRSSSPMSPPTAPSTASICVRCRAALQPGAKFCGTCRAPVSTTPATQGSRFCPDCGTPCLPNARFCGHCRKLLM